MNPTEEPIDFFEEPGKMNLPNLIAIGAFLWYFFISLDVLIFDLTRYLSTLVELDMTLVFWLQYIISFFGVLILAWNMTRKLWLQIADKRLDTKKTIRHLIVGIILVHIAQFLSSFYVSPLAFEQSYLNNTSYFDTVDAIDPYRFISIYTDMAFTICLLFIFVQRKRSL
jgi:branched-subunit amino acid ABC-type transport system permease component